MEKKSRSVEKEMVEVVVVVAIVVVVAGTAVGEVTLCKSRWSEMTYNIPIHDKQKQKHYRHTNRRTHPLIE